jgi:transcriptional regulator with XRE-family HTH domain
MSNVTSGRLDRILAAATLAGQPSGEVLRLERGALRINQTAIARVMGVTRQRVDDLERGKRRLNPEMIERYRAALQLIEHIAPADPRGVTLANARRVVK